MTKPKSKAKAVGSDPDELLTTTQAAAIIGRGERQVREYAERGLLPGRLLSPRTWVFRRADVEAFDPPKMGRPKK
jgi:hypothetical protein